MRKNVQKLSEILLGQKPEPRRNPQTMEGLKKMHEQMEKQPTAQQKRKMEMKRLEEDVVEIRLEISRLEKQKQMIDMDGERMALWKILQRLEPRFDMRCYDVKMLYSIIAWVWRNDDLNKMNLDYSKGLFLYGDIGRGKSLTMRLLLEYTMHVLKVHKELMQNDYRLNMEWMSASMIASRYAANGVPGLEKYMEHDCSMCIDELGREPIPTSYYGTKMNVMQFLMQIRYDNRFSSVTHVTTNLAPDEIESIYGRYIADRCVEMFNFINFSGESLRRP